MWFRDDLRVADNPALTAACDTGLPVINLFLADNETPALRPLGSAARWWLDQSLHALAGKLDAYGNQLILRRGPAATIIPEFARQIGAVRVFWNRRYGFPADVDRNVEQALLANGIAVETHKSNLLFEPDEIRNRAGKPFQVYSAFWRTALAHGEPRPPLAAPKAIPFADILIPPDNPVPHDLSPIPSEWPSAGQTAWQPGEDAANDLLDDFLDTRLSHYAIQREIPGTDGSSRLSPHLRFGEISPSQIWQRVHGRGQPSAKFLSEIGWREFAYHLLGQYPDLASRNLKPAFDNFPWAEPSIDDLAAWREGRTGYPIVDAGMRQLRQTGWMHNRVRMLVASFLTKHLLVDWRVGEEWFWDSLVDADSANNPSGWQWVAGSGADAQPYFRIFNPVLQGEKFDPKGIYVRRYVPEIAGLPDRFIHKPWLASPIEYAAAGGETGQTYPAPIVDHGFARKRALSAYEAMKRTTSASALDAPAGNR